MENAGYLYHDFQHDSILDNNIELLETTHLTMALLFKQHWKAIVKESRKTFEYDKRNLRFRKILADFHFYLQATKPIFEDSLPRRLHF